MTSRAELLLMVAAVVIMPALAYFPGRKSITNPDFPCGEPYGPNGEPPERRRVARQIVFPDHKMYQDYLERLLRNDEPNKIGRQGETSSIPFCGATVISDHFIITAAHCVVDTTEQIRMVTLVDSDLTRDEENSMAADYEIADVFVHPGYNNLRPTRYNDVALIMTKQKMQFNDGVFPYCIDDEIPAPGTVVLIPGFGFYNATTQPDHFLEANFKVMDTAECEDIYLREGLEASLRSRYPNLLRGTDIICAIDNVSNACQGDSTVPVLREKNGKLYLEGIVSGGPSCRGNCKSVLPELYTSLAKHVDFINEHVFRPPPPAVP